ncbi:MAG: hypothetical protein IKT29_07390 [Flavobacteriales bacterium]|nr:hypothetical protein [Flavobacteriales bacterium]
MKKGSTFLSIIALCGIILSCGTPSGAGNDVMTLNKEIYTDSTYTHVSVIETLGVPSSCDSLMTDSYGDIKTYHYGSDYFTFALDDGRLVDCNITTSYVKLNDIAGVGDNVSALNSAAAVKGNGDYYVVESDTHIITIYYENDIITKLTVSAKL